MGGPSKEALERMPLAEAVMWLWRWGTGEERLAALWDRLRGRCYEKVISFPLMVHLIADALLQYGASGRASFQKSREDGELETSIQAAYGKLRRLPIPLSEAFLSECSAALTEAYPPWACWEGPASLRKLRVVILDGKAIKHVAKRLQPLRGVSGGLLGGRALVALDWETELAIALRAHPDGDANDVAFVPELLPEVRQRLSGKTLLFLADRAFPDPAHLTEFRAAGNHFLVRYAKRIKFERDTSRKQVSGQDERERKFVESWGWLGGEQNPHRCYVRLIELHRPGGESVTLITDLLDAQAYPAEDLLWLYAERWGIERVFQKVTEVFGLEGLIGSTPQACIFQLAFCLLLYNTLQVLRGYVAQAHDREPDEVSTEKLFRDVERQLIAWNVMWGPSTTVKYFAALPPLPKLQKLLQSLAAATWSETWRRSPPQKQHHVTPRQPSRSHNSVYRILQARKSSPPLS